MAGGTRRTTATRDDHQAARDRLEERITGRVQDTVDALSERSEASFRVVLETLGAMQADIRRGQIDRASMLSRLGELENALGENRDATNLLRERVVTVELGAKDVTIEAIVEAAPAVTAAATRAAPREIWTSLSGFQKAAATVAAIVAILAGLSAAMTGLERLVRGGWEGLRVAWTQTRGPAPTAAPAAEKAETKSAD